MKKYSENASDLLARFLKADNEEYLEGLEKEEIREEEERLKSDLTER